MRVGIIGGGQLAMMLCQAATDLGLRTTVLDPNPDCSSSHVCDDLITASYSDLEALKQLAADSDVVTYEFENVDSDAIDEINSIYHNVVQSSLPLRLSNDRLIEKQMAAASSFEPVKYCAIESATDALEFIDEVGLPIVIKTRKFGYDGKGQIVISDVSQLPLANEIIEQGAIAEQMIDLAYETSVIAVRNNQGQCRLIPSTINQHRNNILFKTETIDKQLDSQIEDAVGGYLEYHNLVGIVTVEVFVSTDDHIYFNEIAPRPHNSGHWSIEGCNHSQFDVHLRAICNFEMPEVKVLDRTVMINVLGQDYLKAIEFITGNQHPQIYFHDYLKTEIVANRKMGHITAVGSQAISILENFENKL